MTPDEEAMHARDNRVCTCGHKCVSHGSYRVGGPRSEFIGVGMGACGFCAGADAWERGTTCEQFAEVSA